MQRAMCSVNVQGHTSPAGGLSSISSKSLKSSASSCTPSPDAVTWRSSSFDKVRISDISDGSLSTSSRYRLLGLGPANESNPSKRSERVVSSPPAPVSRPPSLPPRVPSPLPPSAATPSPLAAAAAALAASRRDYNDGGTVWSKV